MDTQKTSLSARIVKLTQKYKELAEAYRNAQKEIEQLRRENEELRLKLDAALRELREIERAISDVLDE